MAVVADKRITNPLKSWLAEFLLIRELYNGPSGKPLYNYQVTAQEYDELRTLLTTYSQQAFHFHYEHGWAAGFCLYISECYRREYDDRESGWAWAWPPFEKRLGCNFTPQQRAVLVTTGLEGYWKRPIRQRERGRDLLGSLFAEGGLPWLLVQSDSHGFGRTVRKGLKEYYRAKISGRTITDLLADSEQYLPQTFRTLETRLLLAGIVEQLMYLAEEYALREQEDPAAYLDYIQPMWRKAFPIPLDETNAKGLINDWLKDAGQRRQEHKLEVERLLAFTCTHCIEGKLTDWAIRSEVIIPKEITFPLGEKQLNSLRLEMCFYEGERLLAVAGIVYGSLANGQLSFRTARTHLSLKRRSPQNPITMRLLANGNSIHTFQFTQSVLEYDDLPMVFEARDEEWWFVSSTSCSISDEKVRVYVPAQFHLVSGAAVEIARGPDNQRWLEATDDITLADEQSVITIKLRKQPDPTRMLELQGSYVDYASTPGIVYRGWPRLVLPEGAIGLEDVSAYANGNPVRSAQAGTMAGRIKYRVQNKNGETVLQRRFGILPENFQLSILPASSNQPARLKIKPSTLKIETSDQHLQSIQESSDDTLVIALQPIGPEVPTSFTLKISSTAVADPVLLHLPFPYQGARLIGENGAPLERKELTLDELTGLQIALSTGQNWGLHFTLQMELVSPAQLRVSRYYSVEVDHNPVLLSLFSYRNDMVQMLGAVNNQDAYIRFSVETERILLVLNIRRYIGQVHWLDSTRFVIAGSSPKDILQGARPAAMLLPTPNQPPLLLAGTGDEAEEEEISHISFGADPVMNSSTPWLIYPEGSSAVKFRPTLYCAPEPQLSIGEIDACVLEDGPSLPGAVRTYHPQHHPLVIDKQIAKMAVDFDHNGWQYLADLKLHYSHLPLSTFESWRALARHPEALAASVFRLEIDEVFCARIQDELAVIWECVPLPLWHTLYQRTQNWLTQQGLPDVLQRNILANRRRVLPAIVSGFEYVDNYLETGNTRDLQMVPIEQILPHWYQSLRRTHEANNHWPTELGKVLSLWIQRQDLPEQIKTLSQIEYSAAVAYLPIFMAYVTAGKAQLDELHTDIPYAKYAIKMISDFDRSSWYTCVHAMMVSYLLTLDIQN